MTEAERRSLKSDIAKAYREGSLQWAAYLELCLRVNEAPR